MFRTYGNPMKKLFYLNQTIKQLPVVYIGNKYLNGFVKDSETLVVNQNNDQYKMTYNPQVINSLKANYDKLKETNSTITARDFKQLTVSYRISVYLFKENNKNANK